LEFLFFFCPNPPPSAVNIRERVALQSQGANPTLQGQQKIHEWMNGETASAAAIGPTGKNSQDSWDVGRNHKKEFCRVSVSDSVLRSTIIASQCWRIQHSVLKKRKKRANAMSGCFPTRSAPILHVGSDQARRASLCDASTRPVERIMAGSHGFPGHRYTVTCLILVHLRHS
jgi:hypothetical protein